MNLQNSTLEINSLSSNIILNGESSKITISENKRKDFSLNMTDCSQAHINLESIGTLLGKKLNLIKLYNNSKLSLIVNEEIKDKIEIIELLEVEDKESLLLNTYPSNKLFTLLADGDYEKIIILKHKSCEIDISYEKPTKRSFDKIIEKLARIEAEALLK